jgi:hypothetical protein
LWELKFLCCNFQYLLLQSYLEIKQVFSCLWKFTHYINKSLYSTKFLAFLSVVVNISFNLWNQEAAFISQKEWFINKFNFIVSWERADIISLHKHRRIDTVQLVVAFFVLLQYQLDFPLIYINSNYSISACFQGREGKTQNTSYIQNLGWKRNIWRGLYSWSLRTSEHYHEEN